MSNDTTGPLSYLEVLRGCVGSALMEAGGAWLALQGAKDALDKGDIERAKLCVNNALNTANFSIDTAVTQHQPRVNDDGLSSGY